MFREREAVPVLRGAVAKIRWGHESIPVEAPIQERIVPDGAVHLLFVMSREGARRSYGLAVGATSEPAVVQLAGHIEHVEVELLPAAVPALLGVPAGELSGRTVMLEDLWGDRAAVLRDRLLATSDESQRLGTVQSTLARALAEGRARGSSSSVPALTEACRRIDRASGGLRVRDLAAGLGISERRLEQLFYQHVGLSPKVVSRLARFRASVELLARSPGGAASWADIAQASGFADQSHLVNEFRAVSGLAPGEFQRRAGFGFLQDDPGGRSLPSPAGRRKRRTA